MSQRQNRVKRFFDFSQQRQAFGVLMDGSTARDLYLIIFAVCIGVAFSVITGFPLASPIFTAFLKEELQFSDSMYGLISALPWFTVLVQIPFSSYIRRKPRIKELFIPLLLTVRLSFVLLGILAAFLQNDLLIYFTVFMFVFMGFASALNWMADLLFNIWVGAAVPPTCNGRFFGTRQTVLSAATLIYSLGVTLLTNAMGDWPYKYTLLFILAGIFGSLDVLTFIIVRRPQEAYTPVPEPAVVIEKPVSNRVGSPLKRLRTLSIGRGKPRMNFPRFSANIFMPLKDKRYRTYLLFTTLYSFGIQINSPYVNVYMLEVLKLPLGTQTFLAVLMPGIATVLFIASTGRISDRYGFRNSLLVFGFISAISPLMWLFVHSSTWLLIAPINFLWGITGVATDLAILSMSIFLAPPENRSVYVSSKAIFTNIFGVVPGMLLGGFLSDALAEPLSGLSVTFPGGYAILPFHVLLIMAAVLRVASILIFVRRLPKDTDYNFKMFINEFRQRLIGRARSIRQGSGIQHVPEVQDMNSHEQPAVFLDPDSNLSEDIMPQNDEDSNSGQD